MVSFAIGVSDFRETSGRVQLFHVVTRNSVGLLAPDGFTQKYPPVSDVCRNDTLAGITKPGILAGSVAFTRGDVGNNYVGGAVPFDRRVQPLGIFLNDAIGDDGQANHNGRAPYVCGSGPCIGVSIYETHELETGEPLVWEVGNSVYASRNGLLTNAYDVYNAYTPYTPVLGVVKCVPDANSSLLVFDLRI